MSDIAPIRSPNLTAVNGNTSRTGKINGSSHVTARDRDRVEVSTTAQLLNRLNNLEVREDLVARVRAEIASGNYETEERINATVETLAEELEEE